MTARVPCLWAEKNDTPELCFLHCVLIPDRRAAKLWWMTKKTLQLCFRYAPRSNRVLLRSITRSSLGAAPRSSGG